MLKLNLTIKLDNGTQVSQGHKVETLGDVPRMFRSAEAQLTKALRAWPDFKPHKVTTITIRPE